MPESRLPGIPGRGAAPLLAAAGAGLAAYALLFADPYGLRVLTVAGVYALAVTGYQMIFGNAGALSLAQGTFYGIGAYVTGILGSRWGLGFEVTFPLSVLAPTLLALVVAAPVLRLESHYFALATLGIGQVVLLAAVEWQGLTGGSNGIAGVPGIELFGWRPGRGLGLALFQHLAPQDGVYPALVALALRLQPGQHVRVHAGGDLLLDVGLDEQQVVVHRRDARGGLVGAVGHRVAHVAVDEVTDPAVERRGEEQALPAVGAVVEDAGHVGQEAHVGHVVGLVEDRHLDGRQVDVPLAHEVLEAARAAITALKLASAASFSMTWRITWRPSGA